MKKLICVLLILCTFTAKAQFAKPTGAVSIPTYSFFRTPADSSITIYQGSVNLYSTFLQRWDSVKSIGYTSRKRLNTELFKYRKLNNHDSLNKLDERKYQSLTDTLTWGLGLSQTGHVTKVDTAHAQILSRLRASHEYETKITAGTTGQYWRGDKTWQAFPSGMTWPASAGIAVYSGSSSWGTSITDQSGHWNDAYDDRLKWNGGATGLNASTGRTSLGLNYWATANNDVQTITTTWDINAGLNAKTTLTGNVTITLSNMTVNGMSGTLTVINDATPREITFAGYTNKINPIIRTTANKVTTSGGSKIDLFSWYWDGTNLYWNGSLNYN
jgi:hypothetical protein